MPLDSLSLALLAWLVCVITAAGLIQGALGFGFPFVATPLVAMTSDMRTAVIMVLLACAAGDRESKENPGFRCCAISRH